MFSPGNEHVLYVYGTGGHGPRPESYREDVELAKEHFGDDEEAVEECYFHMKAGAETGWDYSTRWMIDEMVRPVDQANVEFIWIFLVA